MYEADRYVKVQTLAEAAKILAEERRSAVLGGGIWMRLGRRKYSTLIDLSGLGLDRVEERDGKLRLGAACSLRTLETNALASGAFGGALRDSVSSIVGVQLRNQATVGGSVAGRFGFSDLTCALLALEAEAEFCAAGSVALETWLAGPRTRDVLTAVSVPLDGRRAAFGSLRQTATDLPLINLCLARLPDGTFRLAVGARPARAVRCREAENCLAEGVLNGACESVRRLPYGTNLRGSAEYRREMAAVLLRQAAEALDREDGR